MSEAEKTLFWPEERWRELQCRRLAEHLRHAVGSGLYRGMAGLFEEVAQKAEAGGGSVEELLARLPLTTKDQLAAVGAGAYALGSEAVAEWVCTSGTAGRPLDVPLTAGDLERLAENEAAALAMAGVRAGDLFILAVGMERMFVAGLAYWLGARALGATCVRVGPQIAGQAGMLGDVVRRFRRDGKKGGVGKQKVFVIAVPSFLVGVEVGEIDGGMDGIIAIGEPIRSATEVDGVLGLNSLGLRLRERFGCAVMSTYASTETCTTFAEGPNCAGGHLNPRLGIVECVDDAGGAVRAGEIGEIVVTPLGVEGMPLVRFRTGDMAAIYTEKCACGRTTPRVGPIVGRRQQLLKYKGTNVYPGAIIEALRTLPVVADCAVVATQEHALSDRIEVHVVLAGGGNEGRAAIEGRLRGVLRVMPEVRFVGAEELRELQLSGSGGGGGGRKVARLIDRRGQRS